MAGSVTTAGLCSSSLRAMHGISWAAPLLLLLWVLAGGCQTSNPRPKGQLMLSLTTDMQVPKDFDEIQIEVQSDERTLHQAQYRVGGSGLKLPATLALVEGTKPGATVEVRVLALKRDRVRLVREAITTIPIDRIALLSITIEWLCLDRI